MKIKRINFGLIIIGIMCCLQTASADEDNFSISAFAGYYNASSSTFIDSDADFETVPAFGGTISYHLTHSISFELATTKYTSVVDLSFDNKTGRFGEIDQIPILYTVRFQFPIRKSTSHIYLGLGAGYFINDFNHFKQTEIDEFFGVNIKDAEIHNSASWHINAGSEMRLTQHFAMYVDLKAIFSQPAFDVVFEDNSVTEKDVGMNVSFFTCGAKYYF